MESDAHMTWKLAKPVQQQAGKSMTAMPAQRYHWPCAGQGLDIWLVIFDQEKAFDGLLNMVDMLFKVDLDRKSRIKPNYCT